MKTGISPSMEQRLCSIEKELQQIKQMLNDALGDKPVVKPEQYGLIINVNEAMALLKMERHVLYAKCESKDLPSFRVGKQYKFKRIELEEWMAAQAQSENTDVDDIVKTYLQKNRIRG